jgi:hypothetical protein
MHLTYPDADGSLPSADPAGLAGAPDEIEITPEMIEAGVPFLFDYDPEFSNEKDVCAAIFRAMMEKSRNPQ